jgi:hypothetical protein
VVLGRLRVIRESRLPISGWESRSLLRTSFLFEEGFVFYEEHDDGEGEGEGADEEG